MRKLVIIVFVQVKTIADDSQVLFGQKMSKLNHYLVKWFLLLKLLKLKLTNK